MQFADGRSHSLIYAGEANTAGRAVWRFVVPPDAAEGKATIIAAAGPPGEDGKGGKSSHAIFHVTIKNTCANF